MISTAKWIGTVLFFTSAMILSLNISPDLIKYTFVLFLLGHMIFAYIFIKDMPMFFQNVVFMVLDVIGIFRWF